MIGDIEASLIASCDWKSEIKAKMGENTFTLTHLLYASWGFTYNYLHIVPVLGAR